MRALLLVVLLTACSGKLLDEDAKDAAPRPTSTLADGKHFGVVTELDPAKFRLLFDEAELLHGNDALDAARDDGAVVTEGGSYVDDPDVDPVSVTLDPDIVVRLLQPCCELHEIAFEDWFAGFEPDARSFYGTSSSHYEVTIDDGRVVAVDEVYIP